MNSGFRLFAALLAISMSPVRAESVENPDFLRGDAIYQNGKGDAAAFPQAFEAFKVAAEKGHAQSQFFVGRMYHLGDGVRRDLEQAEHWYLLAAQQGNPGAWNNLGVIYGEMEKPLETIVGAFTHASELGNALATFNIAGIFDKGRYGAGCDHVRALEYYRKALEQQPGYPEAWGSIGRIHASGGFGVKADPKAAEEAFFSGIRAGDAADCYYQLYSFYTDTRQTPREMPALACLEKAAEMGHGLAAETAGELCVEGWDGGKPDLVRAAHFYDLGAKSGRGGCMAWLNNRTGKKELLEHYGRETTRAWADRWKAREKAYRAEIEGLLAGIQPVFATGDEVRAKDLMDRTYKQWLIRVKDGYHSPFTYQTWKIAQVEGGRTDAEWGRFLYAWLIQESVNDEDAGTFLGASKNFNSRVIELGRFGLFREACTKMKPVILATEGIDVDASRKPVTVGSDYRVIGVEKLPLVVDVDAAGRSRSKVFTCDASRGEMIGGQAMDSLVHLARERLSVGDWESALVFSEWITRWSDKLTAEKKKPKRDYPGCQVQLQLSPYDLKADVFSALGLPELEMAACQAIIDNPSSPGSYGGRDYFKAQYRRAGILIDQDRADQVDPAMLAETEGKMRGNKYDESHAWQFAKLVRARALAAREGIAAARPIVDEVLASSAADQRPLLRLEALLVSADLELKAGNTEGVERNLEEALTWARGQGLLVRELRTVELYVTWLIATGDYDTALAMQRRALQLIDSMKLSPRRERAVLRLAEIQALRHDSAAASALLAEIKSPSLAVSVKAVRERLEGNRAGAAAPITSQPIDLQPLRIQSMPLRNSADAVFMLANPNPSPCPVELTFESMALGLALGENSREELSIRASAPPAAGSHRLVAKVEVPGNGQLPVTLSAEIPGSLENDATIVLHAKASASGETRESTWLVQPKGGEVSIAVVDAALLRHSPFHLIPAYHHLESADGTEKSTALRVVASEPTRVEGYASDGTLLFVDAQGNGSFRDPGDLVATPEMDGLFPVLNTSEEGGRIGLRYRPEAKAGNGRVELRIETKELGGKADWKADAVDWLER